MLTGRYLVWIGASWFSLHQCFLCSRGVLVLVTSGCCEKMQKVSRSDDVMTFSLCLALTSLQTETWLNGVSGVCFWRALAFCCSLSDIPTLLNATTQPQWRTQRRHRDTARVWYLNTWARKPRVTVTSGTNTKQVEQTSTQISVLCVCVCCIIMWWSVLHFIYSLFDKLRMETFHTTESPSVCCSSSWLL